jgi:hypothetical protein
VDAGIARREHSAADDHVGFEAKHRNQKVGVFAGVVLEVSVLEEHVVPGRDLQTGANRRPFAAVDLEFDELVVECGMGAQNIRGSVARAVVNDDDLESDAIDHLRPDLLQ